MKFLRMLSTGRRRRRNALENEERVLAAAVTAMLRDGGQVPMAAIAAEAEVGVGVQRCTASTQS